MFTKPVVLIGPMGVGKTTIGKKLAKNLELPFIDTDQVVVKSHGPIDRIFETQGEIVFRKLEEETVATALAFPAVIATGGGAILSETTQNNLKSSYVIYLSTDGTHMKSRLSHSKRPLLANGMDDWKRIYAERKPLYEQLADLVIDTSKMSLNETIRLICEKLEEL
jgi:shikimate kinase